MNPENNEATIETQNTAPVVTETVEAPQEEKFDKLSNRDAMEKAISEKREPRTIDEPKPEAPATPTAKEVKQVVADEPEPPSEFSADGKKAWKEKNITGIQKEYRRLHDSRTQEITRAQKAEREARMEGKTWRELGEKLKPYIEARGLEGVPPDKAMMEAIDLIQEFKRQNPATVKAELRKIGIDLDKAPDQSANSTPDPKLDTIQTRLDALEREKAVNELKKVENVFATVFDTLGAQKNRTGEPVFPDLLDNSEEGKELARAIGSRTQDPAFQARILRRFPGADFTVLVREAYRAEGGRVSGEPVQVSTSNQKHIDKSRRAASSTPGRVVARNESSSLIGKLSRRAAIARAIEEDRERS